MVLSYRSDALFLHMCAKCCHAAVLQCTLDVVYSECFALLETAICVLWGARLSLSFRANCGGLEKVVKYPELLFCVEEFPQLRQFFCSSAVNCSQVGVQVLRDG